MEANILVVEDEKGIRDAITIYLKNQGYYVYEAENGVQGLEMVENHTIHLAIVDIMMPVMDGITMTMKLREKYDFPLIFLSAKSEDIDKITGLNIGADDYIGKPFSTSLLKGKINNILKAKERFRQYYSSTINIDTAKMTSNAMDNEFLSKVIQIIEDNISDEKFSTEDLANKLFMSRSNLYIKMNAISGEAPANFIRRIRFNKGCQMLLEGRYTVAEISNKIGFSSPSYFTNSFKKYIGMLPTEYIKKHQEKSNS